MQSDIYISADVETDGPIPGQFSMLAIGLAVAGTFDGAEFRPSGPHPETFYRELRPIGDRFDAAALRASGLDRERLKEHGADPERAMRDARDWVAEVSGDHKPVLVGYPVVFDWMFVHWYLVRFTGDSPFGFSSALDMKTMYQQKAMSVLELSGRDDLPKTLRSRRPHTHNARDDALEQAEVFQKLFLWMPDPPRR